MKTASFEESVEEIRRIVTELESGEMTLDQSILRYEEAVKRLRDCRGQLDDASQKVQVLSGVDENGDPVMEPLGELEDSGGPRRSASIAGRPKSASKAGKPERSQDLGDEVDDDPGLF
ncbi:MAG: exodeoxyribonuclease VII small subunit [Planctomycetota bacterium]